MAYGTGLALQNLGLVSSRTRSFAENFRMCPSLSLQHLRIAVAYLSSVFVGCCLIDLIDDQSSRMHPRQFLTNSDGPPPFTSTKDSCSGVC